MDQTNQQEANEKHFNCFFTPHKIFDDEKLCRSLTHAEHGFFTALCHLHNRCANKDGWFWHVDHSFTDKNGKKLGFATMGFGSSTCKRARIKLVRLKLIEIKPYITDESTWPATMYRINPKLLYGTGDQIGPRSKTNLNSGPGPP
ncbi:MAG: hypothetical protein WC445_01745 [Patescibacteria group bacterium]